MQQKDEKHPIPQYRGAYSLFGGSIEEGETPKEGLKREFEEEIQHPNIVNELVHKSVFWRTYTLNGITWNEFVCHIFIAEIDDPLFEELGEILKDPTVITEGGL
ncbi:MAG: NUDIX domain-containing protein [Parcubacteria group bacterium]|nr:NUDIX domain-containing protein [Parcubacteria group bacterium]